MCIRDRVAAQHAGEVHIAVHSALVRADHGELLLVEGQGGVLLQDVYKRQAVLIATALASFIATALMAVLANYPFALAPGMGPVSYTHLDVYKRQGQRFSVPEGRLKFPGTNARCAAGLNGLNES